MTVADGFYVVHGCRLPIKVNRDDSFGFGSDFFFEPGWVEMEVFIIVYKDGPGSGLGDSLGSGNESIGGGNNFISWSDTGRLEADVDSISAIGATYTVLDPVLAGKSFFKSFDIFAANKSSVIQDHLNSSINFGFERLILAFEINKWNVHLCPSFTFQDKPDPA